MLEQLIIVAALAAACFAIALGTENAKLRRENARQTRKIHSLKEIAGSFDLLQVRASQACRAVEGAAADAIAEAVANCEMEKAEMQATIDEQLALNQAMAQTLLESETMRIKAQEDADRYRYAVMEHTDLAGVN